MTKKFTQSIFILLFLNLLVKPFWIFAIDRTVQNKVGAEDYGFYFSLFSFSLLFNMISDLGLTNYNNRFIAQNKDRLQTSFGQIIPIKIILGGFYCLITILAGLFLNYSAHQLTILFWLTFNQLLVSFTLYLRSNISALQLFNLDSYLSIVDKALMILFCGILLWVNSGLPFKIEWLVFSQTISYFISFLLVLFIVLRKTGQLVFSFHLKSIVHTLKQSFPFALLAILMVTYTRVDAVMLERLLPDGQTEAGIYAQAFRISDALSMFAFLFASILLPLFAKMLKDNEPVNATLSHSFALLMIPSIAVILSLILVSGQFMGFLYQQHAEKSAGILVFLLIGFAGICFTYIFGTLLTAAGKLKILNQLAFSGVVLNVLLNIYLIPKAGAKGAAISSMITQLFMGITQVIISFKILRIKVRIITYVRYLIFFILLILTALLWKILEFPWYSISFVLPVLAVMYALVLKLFRLSNIFEIKKLAK